MFNITIGLFPKIKESPMHKSYSVNNKSRKEFISALSEVKWGILNFKMFVRKFCSLGQSSLSI